MVWFSQEDNEKGAIIRNVIVTADGQPTSDWAQALEKLLGPEARVTLVSCRSD